MQIRCLGTQMVQQRRDSMTEGGNDTMGRDRRRLLNVGFVGFFREVKVVSSSSQL